MVTTSVAAGAGVAALAGGLLSGALIEKAVSDADKYKKNPFLGCWNTILIQPEVPDVGIQITSCFDEKELLMTFFYNGQELCTLPFLYKVEPYAEPQDIWEGLLHVQMFTPDVVTPVPSQVPSIFTDTSTWISFQYTHMQSGTEGYGYNPDYINLNSVFNKPDLQIIIDLFKIKPITQ